MATTSKVVNYSSVRSVPGARGGDVPGRRVGEDTALHRRPDRHPRPRQGPPFLSYASTTASAPLLLSFPSPQHPDRHPFCSHPTTIVSCSSLTFHVDLYARSSMLVTVLLWPTAVPYLSKPKQIPTLDLAFEPESCCRRSLLAVRRVGFGDRGRVGAGLRQHLRDGAQPREPAHAVRVRLQGAHCTPAAGQTCCLTLIASVNGCSYVLLWRRRMPWTYQRTRHDHAKCGKLDVRAPSRRVWTRWTTRSTSTTTWSRAPTRRSTGPSSASTCSETTARCLLRGREHHNFVHCPQSRRRR